jgi:hypothetical protein
MLRIIDWIMLAIPGTGIEIMARVIMTERSLRSPHIIEMKNCLQVDKFSAYRVKFRTIKTGRDAIWKIYEADSIFLKVSAVARIVNSSKAYSERSS